MAADNWVTCPRCKCGSFREDYDLGVDEDGGFTVRYYGRCQECGLRYLYEFESIVPMDQGEATNEQTKREGE